MRLEEAFRRAIKDYFKNGSKRMEGLKGVHKRQKYDKKYFDRIEEDKFGSVTTAKGVGKKDA